jgi:TetR/AcrR family transcriptional regulator, regulator of autoinduction and epiphytic fitness
VSSSRSRSKPYRSDARTRQRAGTRAAIIEAAGALFVADGYAPTTIANIAARADVSPESVYVIFGTKRDLLQAVVETASQGSRDAVLTDDWLDEVRAEPDQRQRLAIMSRATRDTMRRVAPLDEVVRSVAASDPEIAELQRMHDAQRLRDVRVLVDLLADAGPLRVPKSQAAELMWAISRSTGVYRSLTVDRGWSDKRAFDALNDLLARALLPDERPAR